MKKKLVILIAVFLFFLIPGLYLNTQRGLFFDDDFWTAQDGGYASGGNRLEISDNAFDLTLNGRTMHISAVCGEDGLCRFDFDDGTALEYAPDAFPFVEVSVNGIPLVYDREIILTDVDHPARVYASPAETIVEYFYDEHGARIGEVKHLSAVTGEVLHSSEWFYADKAPDALEPVLLYDGIRLTYDHLHDHRYVNAAGDYLQDADDIFFVSTGSRSSISKHALADFLLNAADGEDQSRGSAWVALLYALLYLLGAITILWPEKVAFFGWRWRYRSNPELSEDGLLYEYFCGVISIIGGILLLLLPLFV